MWANSSKVRQEVIEVDAYEVTTLQKGLMILDLLRKKHSLTVSDTICRFDW